ncbi:MAG: aminopeptidase P family protein [Chloroflexi bacterium]|jgi:Xaa-Pro aminopeptidase|nr:aminopeptidase P family protein [Chloroflexota bacterium]
MASRLESLRRALSQQQLDTIFISQTADRRYISGFTGSAGYLLVSQNKAILATDFRYVEQAKMQSPEFQTVQITGEFGKWFPGIVADLNAKNIGFESDGMTLTAYRQLVKAARRLPPKSRPRLIPTYGLVESLRAVKNTKEINSIQNAAALADAAVEHADTLLKPGTTEKELAWSLEKHLRENGSENLPFPIIVASGPNSALPHAQPTDRTISEGESIVIDLGARVNGYCSDITRTICMGKPDKRLAQIYNIVLQAQSAAQENITVGMNGDTADGIAREIIERAGYGDKFGHSLGHGVGLDEHEQPRLGPNSADVLTTNMVFTIEPGIYIEGWGGVRIEDMVLLESEGTRPLTKAIKAHL